MRSDIWTDLVVSMLAVGGFSLDRAYALAGGLVDAGLADPENLRRMTEAQIIVSLTEAGYERGPFMAQLISERLGSLGAIDAETVATGSRRNIRGAPASSVPGGGRIGPLDFWGPPSPNPAPMTPR